MPTGGPVINTAPSATVELAALRSVLNHWHAARFYGKAGEPALIPWLQGYLQEQGEAASTATGQQLEVRRAMWQYANGWLRDAREGRGARHVGDFAGIAASDTWASSARYHVDVTTCTGGHSARDAYTPLASVPVARRCQSDVCAPVWAALDAKTKADA
jgi:hypothetical protein